MEKVGSPNHANPGMKHGDHPDGGGGDEVGGEDDKNNKFDDEDEIVDVGQRSKPVK